MTVSTPLTRSFTTIVSNSSKPSPKVRNLNFYAPLSEKVDQEEQELQTSKTPKQVETAAMSDSGNTVGEHIQSDPKSTEPPPHEELTGPISMQENIAFARAILSDINLLKEMNDALGDVEKEIIIKALSKKTGDERMDNLALNSKNDKEEGSKLDNDTMDKEKANMASAISVADDVEMEEVAPSNSSVNSTHSATIAFLTPNSSIDELNKVGSNKVSFSSNVAPPASILRTTRRGGGAGCGGGNTSASATREQEGITLARTTIPRIDKPITLKKGITRPHIHLYTLRFKTNKPCSDNDEQQTIQATLQIFLETVLQADPKAIIPPYLELDRGDKNIVDLSSSFSVASIDSFHSLKKYFFCLSQWNKEGQSWCSLILALNTPFPQFMEKARYALENQYFSLWPKASDNETATDVGWLLYSTRHQDEVRLASLFSRLTGENSGVKWKPIRTTTGPNRRKDPQDTSDKVNALHIECAADRVQEVRAKLATWYDSTSKCFPDGLKMRLVPTFSSILSGANKSRFALCLSRQTALSAGLASGTTWEMTNNIMLDQQDPNSRVTL
jgi:hypothetical protein